MNRNKLILFSVIFFLIVSLSCNYFVNVTGAYSVSISEIDDDNDGIFEPLILNPSIDNDMGLNNLIRQGYNGTNITIAILDTGIMYDDIRFDRDGDPDTIDDRIVTHHISFIPGEPDYDLNGHGTTIAGILSARKCYVPDLNFTFSGMAQGVELWSVKVLDRDGYGDEESITQGLRYCLEHKDEIDIINLSFGLIKTEENEDVLEEIENLAIQCWKAGIIVVAAAGNDGNAFLSDNIPLYSISTPSSALDVISVGAMKDDGIADFSSIGPAPMTNYVKPDLVAPGADIVTTYKDEGTFVSGVSGTSYSSPIIAGGIAILLDAYDNIVNPDLVKAALIDSCIPLGYTFYEEGAGVPNFTRALEFLNSESYDGIAVFPDAIEFPNVFDPEKESLPDNVHNLYFEVTFDKILVTVIVGKNPFEGITVTVDDEINGCIIICQDPMESIGQYTVTIDFVESVFVQGSLFLFSPGTYDGYVRFYDGENEVDSIYIVVTISLLALFKIWWGVIATLLLPFFSLLSIWRVKHKKPKSVIYSCPSNIPTEYCKCNMDGTKCWIEYPKK